MYRRLIKKYIWFDFQNLFYLGEVGLLTGYLQCKVRLMDCKVVLYSILKSFEAIVIPRAYYNSLFSLDTFTFYQSGTSEKKVAQYLLKINCYVICRTWTLGKNFSSKLPIC